MVKNGAGKNEAIQESDGDAHGHAGCKAAQHAAGGGTVEIKIVADAGEHRGDDEWLAIGGEANVANEGFVENVINGVAIVDGTMRFAHDPSAASDGKRILHGNLEIETGRRVDSRRHRGMSGCCKLDYSSE